MKIKMQDYVIDIDYGVHVLNRLHSRFDGLDINYLDYIFECIFADNSVADYLINEVKVGEDIVVIDEDSGISFAANVGLDSIYVKTLYNAYEGNLLIGEMQKVLRYAKNRGLQIEIFEKKRRKAYA
ncbi:MAG TPA: hypothetical protein DEB10_13230 [Ruminococcaceae bacterium]|jgi:hypothetical protein|nr:hypothetical protein [Oscillospiraceae bacterium]